MTHKTPCLAACLLIAAAALATARPLTAKEQDYARALERLVLLKAQGQDGLSSKSGASGVRVRFDGLTVVRLNFPSARAALAYAARPSLQGRAGKLKRVEARGGEVVLLGGALLKDADRAKNLLAWAWGASLEAPSVATRRPAIVIRRADGRTLQLRPLVRTPRPRVAPPTAETLAEAYGTPGSSRVVIHNVKSEPDGARCLVRFEGIRGRPARDFKATFDGLVLAIRLGDSEAEPRDPREESDNSRRARREVIEVIYVWKPSPNGAPTFVRSGRGSELLPGGPERFWSLRAD